LAEPVAPERRFRILLVHNAYQQRGGEDAVFASERDLLQRAGHEVACYTRHNDDVAGQPPWQLARDTLWSERTVRDTRALLRECRPDVVHVHNFLPLVSPALHATFHSAGVPVVQTLHNFRLMCPQGMLLRNGRICEDCVGRVPWRAVAYGCYRGSRPQSAALATMLQVHRMRGTWRRDVTLYVALNAFCCERFVAGGLPRERIRIKPNFVDDLGATPGHTERSGLLFVGRLAEEKGIALLAQALRQAGGEAPHLRVVGEGPLRHLLEGLPNVTVLGPLEQTAVVAEMRRAACLVMPSIWYENMPRTLVEAAACGLPTLAGRLGALPELVEDGTTGLLFAPADACDLADRLTWAGQNPDALRSMGQQARARYERHWTAAACLRDLQALYAEAITLASCRPSPA
jgi:glycosyltransferase involved in cell wall biosynthesis